MHRVEPFGLALREMEHAHGTNLEPRLFDALNNLTGIRRGHRVRLYDG